MERFERFEIHLTHKNGQTGADWGSMTGQPETNGYAERELPARMALHLSSGCVEIRVVKLS